MKVEAPSRSPSLLAGADGVLLIVGAAAVFFPLVYLLSDVIEVAQGEFSTFRLTLTYIGEAGFPLFVIGICGLIHQRLPWWSTFGGIAYAYAFVFFTSTVIWAIVAGTPDWETLGNDFGWWMTAHGAVMVVGGVALGVGIARTAVLPRWTGVTLAVGVILVAAASGLGNVERTLAAAAPDVAFVGMGLALLKKGGCRLTLLKTPPTRTAGDSPVLCLTLPSAHAALRSLRTPPSADELAELVEPEHRAPRTKPPHTSTLASPSTSVRQSS